MKENEICFSNAYIKLVRVFKQCGLYGRYIKNLEKDKPNSAVLYTKSNMLNVLACSFYWDGTPETRIFWGVIYGCIKDKESVECNIDRIKSFLNGKKT